MRIEVYEQRLQNFRAIDLRRKDGRLKILLQDAATRGWRVFRSSRVVSIVKDGNQWNICAMVPVAVSGVTIESYRNVGRNAIEVVFPGGSKCVFNLKHCKVIE